MLMIYMSVIQEDTDKTKFEMIYDQYEMDVFKRIFRILKNQQDTEDVMQETWFEIAKHIETFHTMEENMIKAYILRSAKNRAINLIRKKKRERFVSYDTESVDLSDDYDYETILFNLSCRFGIYGRDCDGRSCYVFAWKQNSECCHR